MTEAADADIYDTVETLEDYVKCVSDFSDSDDLLLRGHQRTSWRLIPSLSRLQRRFKQPLIEVEQDLLKKFRREARPYLKYPPGNDWEWLAVAQHHGLATRLLDWTSNPLAALWFAVSEPAVGGESGMVFMIVPRKTEFVNTDTGNSPFDIKRTRFFQPPHISERIVAQGGWFSAHAYSSERDRVSDLMRISAYRARIKAIEIPAPCFADLRWSLDRMGVHEASLFPDLVGLSRHLNWRASVGPDET